MTSRLCVYRLESKRWFRAVALVSLAEMTWGIDPEVGTLLPKSLLVMGSGKGDTGLCT
jgi:hypothetical protein